MRRRFGEHARLGTAVDPKQGAVAQIEQRVPGPEEAESGLGDEPVVGDDDSPAHVDVPAELEIGAAHDVIEP